MRNRFVAILLASACAALFVVSCSESPTTSAPSATVKSPSAPSFGYIPGCDPTDLSTCGGVPWTGTVHTEQLIVCKQYPAGTVNPPSVQVVLDVKTNNPPRTPQSNVTFTIEPNKCLLIWQNGELFGPEADTVYVTEQVPAGYTASSQVTTIQRVGPRQPNPGDNVFTTTVNAPTSASTVKGYVGGYEIPGMLVVFTNTFTPPPPPPPPSCTFTQGYWKNHEDVWPAPYSPTAQWLNATHQVTGLTWDGIMSVPPKGGNSYLQLAHQWIAATLNGGANAPAVSSTLSTAGAWLIANTPANGALPNIKNAQATAWASTLDDFNNGRLGTAHCE